MTDTTVAAAPTAAADSDRYHCTTCQTTVDIPLDLTLELDAGVIQDGKEDRTIDLNEPWYVLVNWALVGKLAKCICVDWCVSVKFESMGSTPEFEEDEVQESDPCVTSWTKEITTDHITDTGENCGNVYRIVVVVAARDRCEGRPVGITGFCDLGIVQFYGGKTDP